MAKQREYRPVFSDLATESILSMPKRLQRKAMEAAYSLARNPFLQSDYVITDTDGRKVEHLLVEEFVITYCVDHGQALVMMSELETA